RGCQLLGRINRNQEFPAVPVSLTVANRLRAGLICISEHDSVLRNVDWHLQRHFIRLRVRSYDSDKGSEIGLAGSLGPSIEIPFPVLGAIPSIGDMAKSSCIRIDQP